MNRINGVLYFWISNRDRYTPRLPPNFSQLLFQLQLINQFGVHMVINCADIGAIYLDNKYKRRCYITQSM